MKKQTLTCIECPVGCAVTVETKEGKVISVTGNSCPRGKVYAENEVTCPKRILTSTVRTADGKILPVKTSAPVEKQKLFELMEKIKKIHPVGEVKAGDILVEDFADGAQLVVTGTALTENKSV